MLTHPHYKKLRSTAKNLDDISHWIYVPREMTACKTHLSAQFLLLSMTLYEIMECLLGHFESVVKAAFLPKFLLNLFRAPLVLENE